MNHQGDISSFSSGREPVLKREHRKEEWGETVGSVTGAVGSEPCLASSLFLLL